MLPSLINHPKQNRILAALPAEEFAHLLDDLELVTVELGQVLYEPGDSLRYVYFPTNCIVSLVFTTESGASAELAIAGNDGLVGTQLILGGNTTNHRAVVQSAGKAYRVSTDVIRWELNQSGVLQQLALRYTQALMTQMAQGVVCNRHHTVDQQLCRWLLLSLDRLPGNQLNMTQELIANMLGVRREAVTEAAGKLQAAGLIHYRRGRITVIDRPNLEVRVCECYKVVKQELDRLLLTPPPALPVKPRARPTPATLRERAEARLQQTEATLLPAIPNNSDDLLHELQLRHVELEMHNEELRLAYEESDALRTRYADIYDFAPVGYVTIDAQGTILDLNLAGAILLGIKRSQKNRERFAASVKQDDQQAFNQFLETALSAKNKVVCEIMLMASGQRPETMVRIEAVHDEAEEECRMVMIDVSAEKKAEKAFVERDQYQRTLLDHFPFGVWLKDKESAFLAVNTPFAKKYELSSSDAMIGKNDFDITTPKNAESRQNEDRSVLLSGEPRHTEKMVEMDGEQRCFEIFNTPISIAGQTPGTMGFARDVTESHLAKEALKESERRYRSFIEDIPLGIVVAQDGKIKYLNPKAAETIGFTRDECVGHEFMPLIFEADRPIISKAHSRCMAGDSSASDYEMRIVDKQGRVIEFHMRASPVEWEGRIATMAVFEEVTESQFAQAEMRRLATTDSLTELPNLRHFMERVAESLSRLRRDPDQMATLLVLDIDHFEDVIDNFGHETGDAALRLFAEKLREKLRREDTAGRISGERFSVLLPGSDLDSAAIFAGRLREQIAATSLSFNGQNFSITVSIGISSIASTDSIAEQALFRASEALHRAKAAASNRIELVGSS